MLTVKRSATCSTRGGSQGTYITFASAMRIRQPALALKPRGDVTRNPKQGYQWPQNRTCVCVRQKYLKKKKKKKKSTSEFSDIYSAHGTCHRDRHETCQWVYPKLNLGKSGKSLWSFFSLQTSCRDFSNICKISLSGKLSIFIIEIWFYLTVLLTLSRFSIFSTVKFWENSNGGSLPIGYNWSHV